MPAVDAQLRSLMGQFGGGQPAPGGDHPTNDNAETVHISSLALLKVRARRIDRRGATSKS